MKKIGFFVTLPRGTVAEIRRRARKHGVALWRVVVDAIVREKQAKMHPHTFERAAKQYENCPNFSQQFNDSVIGGPRRKARGKR